MFDTPYYLIDEIKILKNLKIIEKIQQDSGVKSLLALKCFSTFGVFPLISQYLSGTTSSSLYELRLGYEKFKGETHAYSVAYEEKEIDEVLSYSDKIIFNSISQLNLFQDKVNIPKGLRVNLGKAVSGFEIANPACDFSRLGEKNIDNVLDVLHRIDGIMIHNNCENDSFEKFYELLNLAEEKLKNILPSLTFVSLGGGISFTNENYPIDKFCQRLKDFQDKYKLQVYLEPGEATITNCASLEVSVLDIVENEKKIAIVNSSTEAHMLDLLIYRLNAKMIEKGDKRYIVAGKTCLAGDVFGEFSFQDNLKIGDRISFQDAAGYTMVKANWFNGLKKPSIVIKRLDGSLDLTRSFDYDDFVGNLG